MKTKSCVPRSPGDILLREELRELEELGGGRVKVVHVVGSKVCVCVCVCRCVIHICI